MGCVWLDYIYICILGGVFGFDTTIRSKSFEFTSCKMAPGLGSCSSVNEAYVAMIDCKAMWFHTQLGV